MQPKWDFAGSTDMWSTSAGGQLDRFYCILFGFPSKQQLFAQIVFNRLVFGRVRKIAQELRHVCASPSFRPSEWNNSALTARIFMKFNI
jgi:hypothetical protein